MIKRTAHLKASAKTAVKMAPAGEYILGSDEAERESAYRLDEAAYGHSLTRRQQWYENEYPRQRHSTDAFHITRTPITVAEYAAFVQATGHRVPDVSQETWESYNLIHPYARIRRFAWTDGTPPGYQAHPRGLSAC